jgi:hypothetical protein
MCCIYICLKKLHTKLHEVLDENTRLQQMIVNQLLEKFDDTVLQNQKLQQLLSLSQDRDIIYCLASKSRAQKLFQFKNCDIFSFWKSLFGAKLFSIPNGLLGFKMLSIFHKPWKEKEIETLYENVAENIHVSPEKLVDLAQISKLADDFTPFDWDQITTNMTQRSMTDCRVIWYSMSNTGTYKNYTRHDFIGIALVGVKSNAIQWIRVLENVGDQRPKLLTLRCW